MAESPYLNISFGLEILHAIGDFHIKGHVKDCYPQYSLRFIEGAGLINGKIMETLWSMLNDVSQSTWGATLAHQQEILNSNMNHSNWKKLLAIGEFILWSWNCNN